MGKDHGERQTSRGLGQPKNAGQVATVRGARGRRSLCSYLRDHLGKSRSQDWGIRNRERREMPEEGRNSKVRVGAKPWGRTAGTHLSTNLTLPGVQRGGDHLLLVDHYGYRIQS